MKKIEAIIRPFKCDEVKEAIEALGQRGMTLTEVRGRGQASADPSLFAGAQLVLDFLPKIKLELVVPDAMVQPVVAAIVAAAHTGQPGDGKIFVSPIEQAVRIRSGQLADAAIRPILNDASMPP